MLCSSHFHRSTSFRSVVILFSHRSCNNAQGVVVYDVTAGTTLRRFFSTRFQTTPCWTSRSLMMMMLSRMNGKVMTPSTCYHGRSTSALITAIGFVTSLLTSYPTMTMETTTTVALCDNNDKNKDTKNTNTNNQDDEDFISKIKSKLQSQSSFVLPSLDDIPATLNNPSETLHTLAATLGSQISSAISTGVPTDLSYGFLAGYLSGLALKKIGKVASIALGATFLAMQSMAYAGYIDVHHEKLQKQVEEMLDRNNDGIVDTNDIRSVIEEVRKVAGFGLDDNSNNNTNNLVAKTSGFGIGFWGGFRSG